MKYVALAAAGLAGLAFWVMSANANEEFLASCEAYVEAHGSDVDCECLNEAAQADPSLYEEFAKVAQPEDAENMSEAAQEVVAQCSGE
ncbi:MAG: hypothetical protein AAFR20_08975 [Pseudomonadota bacterium]